MFTIDYCGYRTRNPRHDLIDRPSGSASFLFLLALSPMHFTFPGRPAEKATPGACILYTPGFPQHYQAECEFYNSYLHFFASEEEVSRYGIPENCLFYPDNTEDIHWILKNIYNEFLGGGDCREEMEDAYIRQLLILLHRSRQQPAVSVTRQNIYPELLSLRTNMMQNCSQEWNIDKLCTIMNIGKSQFYKYYSLYFHSTPMDDLIQARLQKARYLLTNDAVTIQQVAYASGFQNLCHFNRLFKKHCGCTPGEYRRQLRSAQHG